MPSSDTLQRLVQALRHGGRLQCHLGGVDPKALPLLALLLGRRTGRAVLLVTADSARARSFAAEARALNGGSNDGQILHLPSSSLSPYIDASVDSRRWVATMGALGRLAAAPEGLPPCRLLVVPAAQLPVRLPGPAAVAARIRTLAPGQELARQEFLDWLAASGFVRVTNVYEEGAYAIRGSLVDLFSPGDELPLRVDFFGDSVESIFTFSPATQMSLGKRSQATVLPASEALDLATLHARVRKPLLALADSLNLPSARVSDLLEALRTGELPPGSQALHALLSGSDHLLTDYLDPTRWFVLLDDHALVMEGLLAQRAAEQRRYEGYVEMGRLAQPPQALLAAPEELALERFTRLNVAPLDPAANLRLHLDVAPAISARAESPQERLAQAAAAARDCLRTGGQALFCAPDQAEQQRLARALADLGLPVRLESESFDLESALIPQLPAVVRVFLAPLTAALECRELGLLLVPAAELSGRRAVLPFAPDSQAAARREQALTLREGEIVVHRDYGIGRFGGVVRRVLATGEYTCLQIEYAQDDFLYVPVHNADVVQRYVGSGSNPPKLDRLGSASWSNRVAKARKGARKLAVNLIELYARREEERGHAFAAGDDYYAAFEAAFPYEDTPDQRQATEEVLADMERPRPMDRLLCGDVGFGKTEVAIRATFRAILDGRQVAVLVPTTVLAEQHRLSFAQRLSGYPVIVESLSRFKSAAEQRQVLKALAEGKIDVVIGTHRLLGEDVSFKALGLVVIDEEHRFGVGHKEKLKSLRTSVDVLSLTATPIPRTLHMALSGVRDLSVIQTAPAGRQEIETHIVHFDPDLLAAAIRNELRRQGQIFFLHNRVEDILNIQEQLQTIVPEARIIVAHGQMSESKLEDAMVRFMNRKADLLLCTTIIESGLDIPTVNTLIVNNADRFGLAQLYQIRGRVGRSTVRASAYFVVPPLATMTGDARMRLATLARFTAVGSGFQVANIDMELRGVGDLLGADQSGHVEAVGFDMYTQLLHEEVSRLKQERPAPVRVESRVELPLVAALPDDYIADRYQRLVFYRMIAGAEELSAVDQVEAELRDRFGPIPEAALGLLAVARLRIRSQELGIVRLEAGPKHAAADLSQAPDRLLDKALRLVREQPLPLLVKPPHLLWADFSRLPPKPPLERADRLLRLIAGDD